MEPSNFHERCPSCPLPDNGPKPIQNHKYGDYIILKPSLESCKELSKLAGIYKNVLISELPELAGKIKLYAFDEFHLTLAMPLKALDKEEVKDLLTKLSKMVNRSQNFDIVFRNPKRDGSYRCTFGSPNYSNKFDIRLGKPSKNYLNHQAISSHVKLKNLAGNIQKCCFDNHLVDLDRTNGHCNPYKAHITLGQIKDHESSKKMHQRAQHPETNQKALSHLVSTDSHLSKCKKHKNCHTLSINFDKIEILRCDSKKGEGSQKSFLGSIDLKTKTITIANQFPGCIHK